MDPLALLAKAAKLIQALVERAQEAKSNAKHAEFLATRADAFRAAVEGLKKHGRVTQAQERGVEILVSTLEAALKHAKEVEERKWYVAMYKSKEDQQRLKEFDANLEKAAQLLQVALQVDAHAILEAVNDDLHALVDDMGARFDEQKQLQRETKESIKDDLRLMQKALEKRDGEYQALEHVIKTHLTGIAVAVRNDATVKASDLGVKSKEAFVVGVAKYEGQPLANSVNDARMVAQALRRCEFRVKEILDPTMETFENEIKDYKLRLGAGTLAVFYFSGHGMEYHGENYLLMSDLKPGADEIDAKRKGYAAQDVLEGMTSRGTGFNLMILDACRTVNVIRSTRSTTQGLSHMDVPPPLRDAGSIIAFATARNAVAYDSDGSRNAKNGLYTSCLLEHIENPKPIFDMIKDVGYAVDEKSGGKQIPWNNHTFRSKQAEKIQLIDASTNDEDVTAELAPEVFSLLQVLRLQKYAKKFVELGIKSRTALMLLEEKHLDETGMTSLEKKTFMYKKDSFLKRQEEEIVQAPGIATIRRGLDARDSWRRRRGGRERWKKLAATQRALKSFCLAGEDARRQRQQEQPAVPPSEQHRRKLGDLMIKVKGIDGLDTDDAKLRLAMQLKSQTGGFEVRWIIQCEECTILADRSIIRRAHLEYVYTLTD